MTSVIKHNLPLVAIVGRTNVGKSTLFNKIIEQRKALVSKIAGTTRDLNFGVAEWQGKKFEIVDTGGLFEAKVKSQKLPACRTGRKVKSKEKSIKESTEIKARQILEKADLILFLVDAKHEILKHDRLIAQILKKNKKQKILVANKIDATQMQTPPEFEKLGLGQTVGISATSGSGVGDLLDKIVEKLKFKKITTKNNGILRSAQDDIEQIKVSIVGRPNVGKSSLLNKILGEERVIVSSQPHTTREPQDILLKYKDTNIELIDTAGMRRRNKIRPRTLEKLGINMSLKKLKESDLALFIIDISQNLTVQDAHLANLITKSGISLIFIANKYDLLKTDKKTTQELTNYIHRYLPFLTWAPVIFVSAKTARGVQKILPKILEIKNAREKKIDEQELNEFLHYLMKKMPPPRQSKSKAKRVSHKVVNKKRAYISKITQIDAPRPIFEIFVTNIIKIPEPYLRYLENNIRKRYGFEGTPIKLKIVRNRK